MSKSPKYLSRRDFLKLAAVGLAAARVATACSPGFEPPGELYSKDFDPEQVIFNGKTVSLNELNMTALGQVLSVKDKLREINQGTFSKIYPRGYLGASFPEGWEPDVDKKSAIILNETETGDYIAQAIIGRKRTDGVALTDDGSGSQGFVNSLASASRYADHSLLVVGPRGNTLWFDNIESENENGKTRIAVDGRQGKVFQINTNKPNLFDSWFKKEEVVMKIGEIDVLDRETRFSTTQTPFSRNFLTFLRYFVTRLPTDLDKDQKVEYIKLLFNGSRMDGYKRDSLKQLLGEGADLEKIIEVIKRYRVDLPFNSEEMAFINSVLSQRIEELMRGNLLDDWEEEIKGVIPDHDDRNRDEVMQIINERTSLPIAVPELYFIQVQDGNGNLKWFLTGRSSVWENDVDRTAWTTDPNAFSIGQNWFTYGEVDPNIVDNEILREQETIINNLPFDDIIWADSNSNKPLMGDFWGNYQIVESRKVNNEAVVFGWDPSEGDSKHSINPGLVIMDNEGNERYLKLKLQGFANDNIDNLPFFSNRWLPIIGTPFSPRIIKDVTEQATDLIQQGFETTSPFGLHQMADYSLMANLVEPGGYTDYSFIQANVSPLAFADLVEPGQFFVGGDDNAMLIFAENEQKEPVKIYRYNEQGKKVGEINVDHPVVLSPKKIGEFRDREDYVIIAEDKDSKDTYVVREQDIFQLGARSARKLGVMLTGEALALIGLIYGGYRLIGNLPLAGNFSQGTVAALAEKIVATS
ncbi:twin-arginine translocation signal domain-containing protein [Candidatus Roizmanbacteria bacterium]|nr:twin-arginine translocation signal domain-containing protein [Candidatus Roizmanbacteria bacterium]